MKLEKYEDKSKKKRKTILISLGVIVLISVSFLLYKTFASFSKEVEFQMMKGQVDYFGNSDVYFAFYNGNEKLEEMPQKDNKDDLVYIYSECDNGAYVEWDEKEWGPMVKNLSKSKTKCSLYFGRIVELDKDIQTVESGDGLYKVEHNDLKELDSVWNKTEYRYAGENPNNYVRFNNEIWRIIGLVNVKTDNGIEQRIKIMRQNGIEGQKDFGNYAWDKDEDFTNNWLTSKLKDMLNETYYESTNGECYIGNNGKTSVKSICDFNENGNLPKGLDEIARNMIDKRVIWNIGTYNNTQITTDEFYEKERGNFVYEGRLAEWNKENDAKNNGVGLIYPSDYGYAVGGEGRNDCLIKKLNVFGVECSGNDWLNRNAYQWTITPDLLDGIGIFHIRSDGNVGPNSYASGSYSVSPVVYLKSSIKILENPNQDLEYGTIDNPFILK